MKETVHYCPDAVTIVRVGPFVEIVVGVSTVRMTLSEAEHMVRAIEQAIDPPVKFKGVERIH